MLHNISISTHTISLFLRNSCKGVQDLHRRKNNSNLKILSRYHWSSLIQLYQSTFSKTEELLIWFYHSKGLRASANFCIGCRKSLPLITLYPYSFEFGLLQLPPKASNLVYTNIINIFMFYNLSYVDKIRTKIIILLLIREKENTTILIRNID